MPVLSMVDTVEPIESSFQQTNTETVVGQGINDQTKSFRQSLVSNAKANTNSSANANATANANENANSATENGGQSVDEEQAAAVSTAIEEAKESESDLDEEMYQLKMLFEYEEQLEKQREYMKTLRADDIQRHDLQLTIKEGETILRGN